jgi:hypothetical protein
VGFFSFLGKLHRPLFETVTSFVLNTLLPNVPTSKKHRCNRLSEKFFIGMFGNGRAKYSSGEIPLPLLEKLTLPF